MEPTERERAWVRHWVDLLGCTAPEAYEDRLFEIAASLASEKGSANEEALDYLRTVVDEAIGLQPVLGWVDLISLVEKELHKRWRANHELASVAEAAYHLLDAHCIALQDSPQAGALYEKLRSVMNDGQLSWLKPLPTPWMGGPILPRAES